MRSWTPWLPMANRRFGPVLAGAVLSVSFAWAGSLDEVRTDTTSTDTIWRDPGRSSSSESDSTQAPRYEQRAYNHRQQVVVGGVVMLCVALAMVAMNNYNPKR